MKFAIGFVISFFVGVGCRYFDIPVGSPAVIPGAIIVFAMTAGYASTNRILNARGRVAQTHHLCGGPSGKCAVDAETAPAGALGKVDDHLAGVSQKMRVQK